MVPPRTIAFRTREGHATPCPVFCMVVGTGVLVFVASARGEDTLRHCGLLEGIAALAVVVESILVSTHSHEMAF